MTEKTYEIVVKRTLTNRFAVQARSGGEAMAKLGAHLAVSEAPWSTSEETETSRQMVAAKTVDAKADPAPAQLGLSDPDHDDIDGQP